MGNRGKKTLFYMLRGGIAMKALQKIIAIAAATGLCGVQAVSVGAFDSQQENSAFSTLYKMSDINRNGVTDIIDATFMSHVLWGWRYVANNAHMDVDGNNVISLADQQNIISDLTGNKSFNYVSGMSGVPFFSGTTSNVYNPSGTTLKIKYYKHVYDNPKLDTTYDLSMTESAFPTSVSSPDMIVDTDDRIPEKSVDFSTGIVYLDNGCTGFVVGDHVIATAAHCVYKVEDESWLCSYFMFPNEVNAKGELQVNTATAKQYKFKEAHLESLYKNNKVYDRTKDYALITVAEDLSNCYHFNLGIPYDMYSSPVFGNYNLYVTGFPGEHTTNNVAHLYTGFGKLYSGKEYRPDMLCYTTDTTGGNSGSPVYIKENVSTQSQDYNLITVIGVHDGGIGTNIKANNGVYFTPIHLKFYLNNNNISY